MGEARQQADRERRQAVVTVLRDLRANGSLSGQQLEEVAAEFAVHRRTVERWLARSPAELGGD